MNELHLFAGAGGGILAGQLLGHRTVCAVEIEDYPRKVLLARQKDGSLPFFPIWDDVTTFDGRPWRGCVDIVAGGFPCTDISAAGKGAGITGPESGLWKEFARIIREVRPRYVFVENSPMLTTRGLGVVLGDMAALGYDAEWGVLGASDVGAPHIRKRIWILAHTNSLPIRKKQECEPWSEGEAEPGNNGEGRDVADSSGGRCGPEKAREAQQQRRAEVISTGVVSDADSARLAQLEVVTSAGEETLSTISGVGGWPPEPAVGRVVDGLANRVDRVRCLGNGQVPQCAADAWRQLKARIQHHRQAPSMAQTKRNRHQRRRGARGVADNQACLDTEARR